MSHRILHISVLLAAILAVAAAPAAAGVDAWSFGGAFSIGDVHFRIGYARAEPYGPSYYFEAARPLAYPTYSCSDRCYRQASRHYHHHSCPLVRHHFVRYGHQPDHLVRSYGPHGTYRAYDPYAYDRRAYRYSDPYAHRRHYGKHKGRGKYKVPSGHLPPPGACRVWFPGRPPGHQPPPTDCVTAQYTAPPGTYVLYGGAGRGQGHRH